MVCDMQSKDTEIQLNETMAKHGFPKPNFKGFTADNTQINWNVVIIIYGLGAPMLGWLISSAPIYSIIYSIFQ